MNILFLISETTIALVPEAYIKAAQSGQYITLTERWDTRYKAPAEPLVHPLIMVYTCTCIFFFIDSSFHSNAYCVCGGMLPTELSADS